MSYSTIKLHTVTCFHCSPSAKLPVRWLDLGPMVMRGVTYVIRSSLYVAVTNRCSTTSLMTSRGPGLKMPSSFQPLPENFEPTSSEAAAEIVQKLSGADFTELVFAGIGEPLVRWPVVQETVRLLRSQHPRVLCASSQSGAHLECSSSKKPSVEEKIDPLQAAGSMPVRLVTNGLWVAVSTPTSGAEQRGANLEPGEQREMEQKDSPAAIAAEIAELFDSVSVALNTADPDQYVQLMVPAVEGLPPREAHGRVCEFVRECVDQGVPTECTIVDRDDVDVPRAQDLATRLGASFRVRPYFPS